jgi:ABC-type sugar transport system ATPase subunit
MSTHLTVEARKLTKNYYAVQAIADATFNIGHAEIVGFAGDNGAGKSTLMKMIAGSVEASTGSLLIDGIERKVWSPAAVRDEGVEMVYQDLALCDNLNVYENIFLGRELKVRRAGMLVLDHATMRTRAHQLLDRLQVHLKSLVDPVSCLSGGQRQMVAICRATAFSPKLVIMDEPTAALSVGAGRPLMDLIRRLPSQGTAVMIVSHRLSDLIETSNRIYVVRRGVVVNEMKTSETTEHALLRAMAGLDEPVTGELV